MKVQIRTSEGRKFKFYVPMILVRFGLRTGFLGALIARNFVDDQTRNYLDAVDFRLLSHCLGDLNKHKGLKIVDVKSANGEEVAITI